jgi:hypothetical protein
MAARGTVAAGGALALTALGLARMARFAAPRHALPRVRPDGHPWPARVSAVVPARDEEATITRCLDALCTTGPELTEVVVVDDASSDGTAQRARAAGDERVVVVDAPPLPAGALGKPAACAAGVALTTGEWLWFVDADVRVRPDLLRRLLALAEESGAQVVSALGTVEVPSTGVAWLLPEVGLALARRLSLDAVADPTAGPAFASGQCLLVRREAYLRTGGHSAVVAEVAEDLALSQAARAAGVGQRVALAPDGFSVAMYADLRGVWDGLLKNSATVRGERPADVLREVGAVTAAVVPLAVALGSRSRAARRVALATYGLQVLTSAGGRWVAGAPVWPAPLAPAAEVALVANWVSSVRRRRTGRPVAWRGRAAIP